MASVFSDVPQAKAIEVFELTRRFNEDTFPNKVNLGVGGMCCIISQVFPHHSLFRLAENRVSVIPSVLLQSWDMLKVKDVEGRNNKRSWFCDKFSKSNGMKNSKNEDVLLLAYAV